MPMRNKARRVLRPAEAGLPTFLATLMIAIGLVLVWVGLTAI
jgi:hypothetical protein